MLLDSQSSSRDRKKHTCARHLGDVQEGGREMMQDFLSEQLGE